MQYQNSDVLSDDGGHMLMVCTVPPGGLKASL